jgi:N6-L-threonylcarbamoyladenine synthase
MKVLGIETSCDETAVSLITIDEEAHTAAILGNTVHSQIDLHVPYGGVFPMLAKREHGRNLVAVLAKTLPSQPAVSPLSPEQKAAVEKLLAREPELLEAFLSYILTIARPNIDLISVTSGPGLEPALWVGILFARALSHVWNIPLVPSNHMEGHILTALIDRRSDGKYDLLDKRVLYPALSLLISGGHTQIVLVKGVGQYAIVGDTRDDAVGECFDKVARMLGLEYPGGPKISALAAKARTEGITSPEPLPRPMIGSDDLDFSFSGLKTAVLYLLKKIGKDAATPSAATLDDTTRAGIAREVEDAITDVLMAKMHKAIEKYAVETLLIGGGVIANNHIRNALVKLAEDTSVRLLLPQLDHSTDNALMIALAGYYGRERAADAEKEIKATGTLPIGPRLH